MRKDAVAVAAAVTAAAAGWWATGPAGHAGAYAALGFIPGWAAACWLLPRSSAATHVVTGVLLAPLLSTLACCALLASGLTLPAATRIVMLLGALGALSLLLRPRATAAAEEGPPLDRVGWSVLALSVLFVAVFPLHGEWLRIRSDGWIHAGIAWDIHEHGVPPVDPRFAGMRLNYVWFYNLLLAMVASTPGGSDVFVTMAMMNLADMAALIAIVWRLAALWGGGVEAARGAVLLAVLGMNAGAWVLAPLQLLRAFVGENRGWAEAARLVQQVEWDTYRVQHFVISAPFSLMVNSWDKWTLGSSIGYTYLFVPFHLYALLRAWRSGGAGWWVLAACSAAAMMLFHGVVGLSVLPASLGALALLAAAGRRLPGGPGRRPVMIAFVLLAAGAIATLPYLRSITAGWDAGQSGLRHSYLKPGVVMPWTLLTACGAALWFARGGLMRWWRSPSEGSALLPVWVVAMAGFALVVHLPEYNEAKFVWPVFILLAVIGGGSAWDWIARPRRGAARIGWAVLVALVFLLPSVLFLQGMLRDRPERSQPELAAVIARSAEDEAFHRWVREETPADAVFSDSRSRDHLMVLGRRRLVAGTLFDAARAAFPVSEMDRRRALEAELHGPLADPAATLAELRALIRRIRERHPVSALYVVFRRAEQMGPEPGWQRLRAADHGVALVYDAGGYVVLRVEAP